MNGEICDGCGWEVPNKFFSDKKEIYKYKDGKEYCWKCRQKIIKEAKE